MAYTIHDKSTRVDKDPEHSYFINGGLNTHRATRNDIKPNNNTFNVEGPDVNGLAMTSTNVFVYANGHIVGMIQDFSRSEQRNVNKIQAIGTEGVIQSVPGNTNGGTLTVNRIALYSSNIWNALGLATDGEGYDKSGAIVYNNTSTENWDTSTVVNNTANNRTLGGANAARTVFKTLKDQRVPLEIQVRTPITGAGVFGMGGTEESNEQLYFTETYIDCWISSYSKTYNVSTIQVAENVNIDYADVY